MSIWREWFSIHKLDAALNRTIHRYQARLVVIVAIGALLSGVTSLVATIPNLTRRGDVQERAHELSRSLMDASQLIDQMKAEIDSRQALVQKLQGDLDTYNKLATLKKTEVEAVAQVLRGELERSGRQSFWIGVLMNFGFFLAGSAVTWTVSWWHSKRGNAILLEQ